MWRDFPGWGWVGLGGVGLGCDNFSFLGYVSVVFPWGKKKEEKKESAVLEATLAQLKLS